MNQRFTETRRACRQVRIFLMPRVEQDKTDTVLKQDSGCRTQLDQCLHLATLYGGGLFDVLDL